MIATDGSDVRTKRVDSLIIAPGERYDVWIETGDPVDGANYWIRVDTLEWFYGNDDEVITVKFMSF